MSTGTTPQACLRRASAQAPGARCTPMLRPPLLICRLWAFNGLAKIGEELLNAPDRTLVALYLPLPAVPGATASISPPGLGNRARPPGDLPCPGSAAAACPHALARSDPPNLARELLGEPEVAIGPARDAERLAARIGHPAPPPPDLRDAG